MLTEVHTWFERDRAHVELRDALTDETILEYWDHEVHEAIIDGELNPRDWKGSLMEVAQILGLIR